MYNITHRNYVFWRYTPEFVLELVTYLKGRKVLEIFAGNGYLASILAINGIEIVSTSLRSGHDGHSVKMHFPVIEMEAVKAVSVYGDRDILLMSWPTTTPAAIKAVELWGKLFIFIGEVINLEKNELGGCATDEFFEKTKPVQYFNYYRGNYLEKAFVGKLK